MTTYTQEQFAKLSITELKAIAFDELQVLQRTQLNLEVINKRIAELQNTPKVETKPDENQSN